MCGLSIASTWSYDKGLTVTFYDGMQDLFRTLGLTEEQARIAACGRQYRSESQARTAEIADLRAEAAEAAEAYAAGTSVTAPAVEDRGLVEGRQAATSAAQSALRMDAAEAEAYVARLEVREVNRGGPVHAGRFLTTFAAGLASGSPVGGRVIREATV